MGRTPNRSKNDRTGGAVDLNRKLVVEFIGTFFLVFTVGTATVEAGGAAPIAIGAVLMVMIFAGGYISGGHYNPAVSTAVLVRGKMTQSEWLAYVITQLVAGVIGGLFASIIVGHQHAGHFGSTGKFLLAELLFTFALAYVVLHVATSAATEGNSYFGLAIGFTVLAGAFAVGATSGGAFNPAVGLGQIVHGASGFGNIWKWWLPQFIGGGLAGITYMYIQGPDTTRAERRPPAAGNPPAAGTAGPTPGV
jgi:aquaporin Z